MCIRQLWLRPYAPTGAQRCVSDSCGWGPMIQQEPKGVYQTAVAEALCSNRSPKVCIRQLWLRPYDPTGAQRCVSDSCGWGPMIQQEPKGVYQTAVAETLWSNRSPKVCIRQLWLRPYDPTGAQRCVSDSCGWGPMIQQEPKDVYQTAVAEALWSNRSPKVCIRQLWLRPYDPTGAQRCVSDSCGWGPMIQQEPKGVYQTAVAEALWSNRSPKVCIRQLWLRPYDPTGAQRCVSDSCGWGPMIQQEPKGVYQTAVAEALWSNRSPKVCIRQLWLRPYDPTGAQRCVSDSCGWGPMIQQEPKGVYQTAVAEALWSNRSPKVCIRQLWLRPYDPTGAQRCVSDSCGWGPMIQQEPKGVYQTAVAEALWSNRSPKVCIRQLWLRPYDPTGAQRCVSDSCGWGPMIQQEPKGVYQTAVAEALWSNRSPKVRIRQLWLRPYDPTGAQRCVSDSCGWGPMLQQEPKGVYHTAVAEALWSNMSPKVCIRQLWLRPYDPTGAQRCVSGPKECIRQLWLRPYAPTGAQRSVSDSCGWGPMPQQEPKGVYQTAVAEALWSNRSPKVCIRQLWLRPYAPTGAQRCVSDSCGWGPMLQQEPKGVYQTAVAEALCPNRSPKVCITQLWLRPYDPTGAQRQKSKSRHSKHWVTWEHSWAWTHKNITPSITWRGEEKGRGQHSIFRGAVSLEELSGLKPTRASQCWLPEGNWKQSGERKQLVFHPQSLGPSWAQSDQNGNSFKGPICAQSDQNGNSFKGPIWAQSDQNGNSFKGPICAQSDQNGNSLRDQSELSQTKMGTALRDQSELSQTKMGIALRDQSVLSQTNRSTALRAS